MIVNVSSQMKQGFYVFLQSHDSKEAVNIPLSMLSSIQAYSSCLIKATRPELYTDTPNVVILVKSS